MSEQQDIEYEDNEADERGRRLEQLLQTDINRNEFLINDDEVQKVVEKAKKRKPTRQEERKKREIKKNVRMYESSIRCYFIRNVLHHVKKQHFLDEDYAKCQILSRLELSDFIKLIDLSKPFENLENKSAAFSLKIRFLMTLCKKYKIHDLNSIQTLLHFADIQTRRLYLIDLTPFNLKDIGMSFGKKNKVKERKPKILTKINEEKKEEIELQLDEPQNYMHVKKKPKTKPIESEQQNTQISANGIEELVHRITLSKTMSQESQKAKERRSGLEGQSQKFQWLDIFDSEAKVWRIFDPKSQSIYNQDLMKRELDGVPSVFIYSVRNLTVKTEFNWLFSHRNSRRIQMKDQTFRFCDNMYKIINRRKRIGVRNFISEMIKSLRYRGNLEFLTEDERNCQLADDKMDYQIACNYFPKNPKEMRDNDTFTIPSMIDKFSILKDEARPTDLMFRQQQVFMKKDLIHLHSTNGWVDIGRMVIQDAQPVKTTLTRDKNRELKLFSYPQTLPLEILIKDGKFVKNQFGSIYINKRTSLPKDTVILKQNIRYVCKKNDIPFAEVVQGFTNMRPNSIGFIVFERDRQKILKLHEQRQKYLEERKKNSEENELKLLWRKLFKAILIADSLQQRYAQ